MSDRWEFGVLERGALFFYLIFMAALVVLTMAAVVGEHGDMTSGFSSTLEMLLLLFVSVSIAATFLRPLVFATKDGLQWARERVGV